MAVAAGTAEGPPVTGKSAPTYRQVDYWTRAGYLRPASGNPTPGSGHRREWDETELDVALLMGKLTEAGLMPRAAALVARQHVGGAGEVQLADGVTVTVTTPQAADAK